MNPSSSSEPVPKCPTSVWLQHKDVFHRLYIIENRTLGNVKQIVEDEYQFPAQRLCDYEVALREVLQLRKNLKQEEWYAIGIHISNRKRQSKESEVVWNGTRLEAKKVRKDVLRNSRLGRRCTRNPTLELPRDLVIRTPPRSPTACLPALPLATESEAARAKPHLFRGEGQSLHANLSSAFDESIGEGQLAWAKTWAEEAQLGLSPTRKLRENLPFNRFMSQIGNLAQSISFDALIPTEQAWTPTPRLFGVNQSWDLLGRHVYNLSNNIYQDWRTDENSWFLNWISISADTAMLRVFFSIDSPTVGAVYERLRTIARALKRPGLLRLLFELRETLRVNNAASVDEAELVRNAVDIGSKSDGMLDIVKLCENNTTPLDTKKVHPRPSAYSGLLAASRCDIDILQILVAAGCDFNITYLGVQDELMGQIMSRIYSWTSEEESDLTVYLDILIRGHILNVDWTPQGIDRQRPEVKIEDVCSITWDELVMVCPPIMRKTLHSIILGLTGGQGNSVSKAGVFTAAQDGVPGLRAYLNTSDQINSLPTRAILEESLVFAAILNDPTTASALLQLGVDPCISLLSDNLERYLKGDLPWNPAINAAAAGSLEVLKLLVSENSLTSFLSSLPIYELVQPSSSKPGFDSGTDASSGFLWQWDFFTSSKRRLETLEYIRNIAKTQEFGQDVDLEIINAATMDNAYLPWVWRRNRHLPCEVLLLDGLIEANLDYEEGGVDLLQLSIRNHCSLGVVRFLLDKGFQVHSIPAAQSGHSMLHDALLSASPDRVEIVKLLVMEGANYNLCGGGFTILEASLRPTLWDRADRSENLHIFKWLFEAGAPVYNGPRKYPSRWIPLVVLLLRAGADDDLILQIVDAGADLNTTGYGCDYGIWNLTPLQASLWVGRERLARALIRRGADVHAPAFQKAGKTALQAACWSGVSIDLIKYLITVLGARVDESPAEEEGVTSLCAAAMKASLSTIEFLLDNGADVNAPSSIIRVVSSRDGRRVNPHPLDWAAEEGSLDTVELLLKAGGRSSTDGLGGAMYFAEGHRHFAVLSVLRGWDESHGRRILEEEALEQCQEGGTTILGIGR